MIGVTFLVTSEEVICQSIGTQIAQRLLRIAKSTLGEANCQMTSCREHDDVWQWNIRCNSLVSARQLAERLRSASRSFSQPHNLTNVIIEIFGLEVAIVSDIIEDSSPTPS